MDYKSIYLDNRAPLFSRFTLNAGIAGFTFIELIMVILIIAIIALVMMNTKADLTQIRENQAALKIKSDIRFAQSYALSSQKATRVVFDISAETYSIYINTSGSTWILAIDPITRGDFAVDLRDADFSGANITQTNFNGAGNSLAFDIKGMPYSYDPGGGATTILASEGSINLSSGVDILVEPNTGRVVVSH